MSVMSSPIRIHQHLLVAPCHRPACEQGGGGYLHSSLRLSFRILSFLVGFEMLTLCPAVQRRAVRAAPGRFFQREERDHVVTHHAAFVVAIVLAVLAPWIEVVDDLSISLCQSFHVVLFSAQQGAAIYITSFGA